MADVIIAASPTCGACFFGRPFREGMSIAPVANAVECWGAPPTPQIIAGANGAASIALLRPRLNKSEPACALYAKREDPK